MSDKVCAMTVTDAKIKKALPPQKKKKLTGVCCERRLNQVVTSTQSFPKSGLQIEISRTRTDKNRENQQRSAYSYFRLSLFLSFLFPHCPEQSTNRNWKFAFFSMVECSRVKFPANTDHRKNSRGHICKMLLRFWLKLSMDDQKSKFQQSKHFLFFVCFFFFIFVSLPFYPHCVITNLYFFADVRFKSFVYTFEGYCISFW